MTKWVYYCKGEKIEIDYKDITFAHGKYPITVCDKCHNIPVTHTVHKDTE